MTSIISDAYASQYTNSVNYSGIQTQVPKAEQQTQRPADSAISITLSEAGKAALAQNSYTNEDSAAKARAKLSEILNELNRTSPLTDGKLEVELSEFEREEIFAVATNVGNKFTEDEQTAAKLELQRRFDAALSGAHSVMKVTGNYKDLYEASLEYLETFSSDEKKTSEWQEKYSAVKLAINQLETNPNEKPQDIKGDPIADYLERSANGETVKERAFTDITKDARSILDNIYSNSGDLQELSKLSTRSLSAIALNRSDTFTRLEITAAKSEMRSRIGQTVQSAFQEAGTTGDPTAFSKKLIAQYDTMSAEEREAAGLGKGYYNSLVTNYETSLSISRTFAASNGVSSLLDYL